MLHTIVFFLLACLTIGAALSVIMLKNLVHSTLMLIITFLGVAAIYLSLQADFLAGIQVMVYGGAVAILIVMAIFLIKRGSATMDETNLFAHENLLNGIVAIIFGGLLLFSIGMTKWQNILPTNEIADSSTENIADAMLTDYVVSFELAAILLLVAMVAAIIISREVKENA